jgi:F-type H+-transporting ATPase subunit b
VKLRNLVVAAVVWSAALPAWAAEEGGETFLGLPTWIWKSLNLLLFIGLLLYLLAKPLRHFFHTRKEAIARSLEDAARQRDEAARLSADMEQRVASLQNEIKALQERLRQEGERERDALSRQGEAEAARLLTQMEEEATRRMDEARSQLAREAAEVAAEIAWDLLEREVTAEDRERIFRTTLERLRERAVGGLR